jgi:hypothetical protein
MTPIRHIATPADLAILSSSHSPDTAPRRAIHIHILAPLSEPGLLTQSREGSITAGHDTYLNLTTLCNRWRAAWSQFPANVAARVVFDVSPPEEMYYSTMVPVKRGTVVNDMDVIRLVVMMATTVKLRSGNNVIFEMMGDGGAPVWTPFLELATTMKKLSKPRDAVA